jgi:hypothetical protein
VPSATYNDRVLYVSATDLIPVVEMRVGADLKKLLLDYRLNSKCRCYPWADSWSYSGGVPDIGVNRGRFPAYQVQPHAWGTKDANNNIPDLPPWVTANNWHNMVFYSAARQETDEAGRRCYYCSANQTLTVRFDAVNFTSEPASAVVFTPGLPIPPKVRPGTPGELEANAAQANDMAAYLEDPLNNNKGNCPGWNVEHAANPGIILPPLVSTDCDTYVKPASRKFDRDRLHMIAATPGSHCATAARSLLDNIPCKDLGNLPRCLQLVTALATCVACTAAAQATILTPCLNTLTPSPHCDWPVSQLKICAQ